MGRKWLDADPIAKVDQILTGGGDSMILGGNRTRIKSLEHRITKEVLYLLKAQKNQLYRWLHR
ncbi:MAG: hypothetical protein UZ03_NOB001003375 [Nitrospira sp. OLB3]|nr:MAG: hypothetical protein UZ03_NOB001003375 [Nitrospira sp. OLB3]